MILENKRLPVNASGGLLPVRSRQIMKFLDNDPTVVHRSSLLPIVRRRRFRPDDMEIQYNEFGVPGILYDAVKGAVTIGAMSQGDIPLNENLLTKSVLDAPMTAGLLAGATGVVPKGAVLGANVGGKIPSGIRAEYARQGRMQPAEAPIGAKGQELGVPTSYSKNLKIPQEEIDRLEAGLVRSKAPNMSKRKILNLENIEGQKIFPLVGDRKSREIISAIGGQKLDQPIMTQGGFGYSMGKDTGGWASKQGIITRLKNKIRDEEGAIGVSMPMAGTGSDYSMHSIDVLYALDLPKQMTKKAQQTIKNLINNKIASKNKKIKNKDNRIQKFPGLEDKNAYNYFLQNPEARKFLMEELDKSAVRKIPTMPDAVMLRQAVTDASLKDMRRGDTDALAGQSFVKFEQDARSQPSGLLLSPHKSYDTDLSGEYLGGLPQAVPRSLLMPDYVERRLMEGYEPFRMDYLMTRDIPFQTVTPKMVDTVGKYIEDLTRRGGK